MLVARHAITLTLVLTCSVDLLLGWIEGQLADEALFPQSTDRPFPKTFKVRDSPSASLEVTS